MKVLSIVKRGTLAGLLVCGGIGAVQADDILKAKLRPCVKDGTTFGEVGSCGARPAEQSQGRGQNRSQIGDPGKLRKARDSAARNMGRQDRRLACRRGILATSSVG